MGTKTEKQNKSSNQGLQRASVAAVLFWNSIDWDKIEKSVVTMQHRIVEAIKKKRFNKSKALRWVLHHSFKAKLLAIKRVTQNKGGKTPGIDGITWKSGADKIDAAQNLAQKGYKAKPLKRVVIPKKNGKKRSLGIPVLYDRAQQALHKLALEPLAETQADRNSYGFRLKRGCADAIEQCFNVLKWPSSPQWILEADIKACFDNISHRWTMDNIPSSKYMPTQWLKSGFIDKNKWFPTKAGTPQGGIVSPIIANMVLDGMETLIRTGFPAKYKVKIIRYADDFIITATTKEVLVEQVKPLITKFLAKRGLELSEEKTKVSNIYEGFDFLGQNVRKYGRKLLIKPSKKSISSVYRKIRGIVKSNPTMNTAELIYKLNPIITGWANYHRHVVSKRVFTQLDNKIFRLLWNWSKRRHPNKSRQWVKSKYFKPIGTRNWVFSGILTGTNHEIKLALFESTRIVRHIKIKAEANPFDIDWQNYFINRRERFAKKRYVLSSQNTNGNLDNRVNNKIEAFQDA
jgi:RNA-directed DNA polymerase